MGCLLCIKIGQCSLSTYCASKNTVIRLTESLSNELKFNGINVNAVIDTPVNQVGMPDATPSN
ncbi:SDR family NAD(P)-dependent oxidoreductase [Zhongshania aliphaticivorans]|uniref:SDR family NAD(P)-dependent oxidoreductase n=1 Tax=Zhongshania aliphaticivorans TaxID=1470434 RepID=UPI0012E5DE14|nr:Uncharacterised protein [Zhongshania aliphaticivorans]